MKPIDVDPDSPVPLYHQIAEAIRRRIERGELSSGDALEPLREAAHTWGVNLHTVRHAYTALARQGLVESLGARGTRVSRRRRGAGPSGAAEFVRRVVEEAREMHGLDPRALSREIAALAGGTGAHETVYVVECSAWQCEAHARQIEARFEVDAREWSLERQQEPPPGTVVATYFHYNDIRRLWPDRLREITFITIVPDPRILERLPADVRRVLVCERDEATAATVAADISVLLRPVGCEIEPVVAVDPAALLDECGPATAALVSPRVWASVDEATRSHERVLAASYVFDAADLDRAAERLGWPELAAVWP